MDTKGFAIAIDGPGGVGKSTTARLVAEKLKMVYIDTGAMYRSVALFQMENGLDLHDEASLEASLAHIELEIRNIDGAQKIFLNDRDVTEKIRTQEVGEGASVVAANPRVREKLVSQQQKMAAEGRIVMDGRDIGSLVLPWAQLKIYLDATIDIRAKRRKLELDAKGIPADLKKIREETAARDHSDKTRKHSPLTRTPDAIYLDTGEITPEQTAAAIIKLVQQFEEL